jgi:hypothetical protein
MKQFILALIRGAAAFRLKARGVSFGRGVILNGIPGIHRKGNGPAHRFSNAIH